MNKCYLEKHKGVDKLCYRNQGRRVRLNIQCREQKSSSLHELERMKENILHQAEYYVENYRNNYGVYPNTTVFKNDLKVHRDRKIDSMGMLDYYYVFLKEKKAELNLQSNMSTDYDNLGHLIEDYQTFTGKTFYLVNINKVWIDSFVNFLLEKRADFTSIYKGGMYYSEGGLKATTVKGRMSKFRTFSNWLEENKYYPKSPAINKKIRELAKIEEEVETLALDKSKLNKLINFDVEGEDLVLKDFFIFLCLTGMRYSDFITLNMNHIKNGNEIRKIAVKTKKLFKVKLNKIGLEILSKYKTNTLKKTDFFNDETSYLKEDNTYKKEYETVTSKTGRYTFINIALDEGVPTRDIMVSTGHTTLKSFEIYEKRLKRAIDFTDCFIE